MSGEHRSHRTTPDGFICSMGERDDLVRARQRGFSRSATNPHSPDTRLG